MTNSYAISKGAWLLYVALRVVFIASVIAGVVLLALGKDYGIFFAMFGCYSAMQQSSAGVCPAANKSE